MESQDRWEQKPKKNEIVVNEAPKFDLEAYIGNYSGRTRIDRLLLIGECCKPLAAEALKLAIGILKKTSDFNRYTKAVAQLAAIAPTDPDARLDEEWVERTSRTVTANTEKYEAQLKSYRNNLIKESIRMGHEDLGNHYYASGDLSNAFKSYSRMRDFCTAPKHMLDMSLQIIKVCIEQSNYMAVQSHIVKIKNLLNAPADALALKPKMAIATGLVALASHNYREAAKAFLETPNTLGTTWNDVISPNDVAVYGGLCALASMDRAALKSEVLDNNEFRQFLELEPHIRRAITCFYGAKYHQCLSILQSYKNDYLLDIYLQKHVAQIYHLVRSKSIIQYFVPFNTVPLAAMSEAFGSSPPEMERELVRMIEAGKLNARIDTLRGLVVAKETNARISLHENALKTAQEYERAARAKLLRIQLVRAGLEVKNSKGRYAGGSGPFSPSMMKSASTLSQGLGLPGNSQSQGGYDQDMPMWQ